MASLDLLAADLDVSGRTLRRAFHEGTIRGRRPSPRRFELSPAEESYVLRAWPLLGQLRELLRTERNVRLAVLYGSRARGDERPESDVDLLVELADDSMSHQFALADRLERAVGLPVQIVALSDARRVPLLLAAAVDDGRVLVDRDGGWAKLESARGSIAVAAVAADADLHAGAQAALAELKTE